MMGIVSSTSRQKEILEILLRHGWSYMQQVLSFGKTDQPELPPPTVLRNILTDLGPVYVKLGQLLSTRPDLLPPSYIETLSQLQSSVPPVPWSEVETVLKAELKQPLNQIFSDIQPTAIAAGSIAQIHRAVLVSGEAVAIKIQRPGLSRLVDRDIQLITQVAELVSGTDFGRQYDVVALAEEFSSALRAELDFTQEASYTETLGKNLSKGKWFNPQRIITPEVFLSLTTPRVLTLGWLEGTSLLQAANEWPGDLDRSEITTLLFRAFFQQYLVDGFFHADPHPGNLFLLRDGRVAILDCGMMGRLDGRTQAALVEIVLAIISLDAQRCMQITLEVAEPMEPVDLVQLEWEYNRLLRKYVDLSLTQVNTSQAFYEILQAARRNNLRWPSNIGLFAKSLANLEGTGRQFYPAVNVVEEVRPLMNDMFWRQLVGDDFLQSVLRTGLEFKNLSLVSPRQFGFLLNRLTTETLKFNLNVESIEMLSRNLDSAANRRSFSTVVGALVIGAAIVSTNAQTPQFQLLSNILFGVASLLGLWLVVTIIRSGQLK